MPTALPRENTDAYPCFSEGGGNVIHTATGLRGQPPTRASRPEPRAETADSALPVPPATIPPATPVVVDSPACVGDVPFSP